MPMTHLKMDFFPIQYTVLEWITMILLQPLGKEAHCWFWKLKQVCYTSHILLIIAGCKFWQSSWQSCLAKPYKNHLAKSLFFNTSVWWTSVNISHICDWDAVEDWKYDLDGDMWCTVGAQCTLALLLRGKIRKRDWPAWSCRRFSSALPFDTVPAPLLLPETGS